jgi:hypothetical protein
MALGSLGVDGDANAARSIVQLRVDALIEVVTGAVASLGPGSRSGG